MTAPSSDPNAVNAQNGVETRPMDRQSPCVHQDQTSTSKPNAAKSLGDRDSHFEVQT
jgi:hypothetical protein